MKLTPAQIRFFETFGYLSFPGLVNDRIDRIIEKFEALFAAKGGGHHGKPHDGKNRSAVVPFIDQCEYLSTLVDDARIDGIAAGLLGEDYNYLISDGNYYVGGTGWHSDSYWANQTESVYLKVAFYLDPVGRDSGCLRVIPGSHRVGEPYAEQLNRQVHATPEHWGVPGQDVPCVALETRPGDVIVFNHHLKHASFFGSTNRRMFTLNYCQRYSEQDLPKLRQYIGTFSKFWIDRVYGDIMVKTATPSRMRHLEQIMANDGHVAALAANARLTMPEPSRF